MKRRVRKKRRRKPDKKDRVRAVFLAASLIAAAVIFSVFFLHFRSAKTGVESEPVSEVIATAIEIESTAEETPQPDPKTELPAKEILPPVKPVPKVEPARPAAVLPATERLSKGTIAFVIDDAGNSLGELEPFLKLSMPLTIAVLPGLPHSAEAARRIRAAGKEVFLHQPMEAVGGNPPGPFTIMVGMGRDEIRAIISRNLAEIGPAAGINNHEGSLATGDKDVMETVLDFCKERGLLFLDSRTTAETAAPGAARRLGMKIGERDVFVDNEKDRESMLGYMNLGIEKAGEKGQAILLGHVQSAALAPLLHELFLDLQKRGYSISPASDIIKL